MINRNFMSLPAMLGEGTLIDMETILFPPFIVAVTLSPGATSAAPTDESPRKIEAFLSSLYVCGPPAEPLSMVI
jgi:hypothetical protein